MDSLQAKLIESSDKGYFIVYHVELEERTYIEILRIDIDFLAENDFGVFFEACDMFEKVKKHLSAGTYFSVFKNVWGTEWFVTVVPSSSEV